MTGALQMTRALLRTGRLRSLVWPLAVVALVATTAASIVEFYDEPASRGVYAAALAAASIMSAIGGASGGLDLLGGIVANELAIIMLPTVAAAGILLAIGATRSEEDHGRTELLTARRLGRLAPLAGAIASTALVLFLMAAFTVAGFVSFGIPLVGPEDGVPGPEHGGAWAYGALVFAYALLFAGVGFVAAELARDARSAGTLAFGVFGVAFGTRVWINGSGHGVLTGEVGLSWLTPVGWFDAVAPFAEMRWTPLALMFGTAAALMVLAGVLRHGRDLGSGVIAPRPGRTAAAGWVATPLGLTWRQARPGALAWLAGAVAMAALMGGQLPEWIGALQASQALLDAFGMSADATSITRMALLFGALLASAAGLAQLGRWSQEEPSGRVGLTLARAVSRRRLWTAHVIVTALITTGITVVSGAVYALTGWLALDDRAALDLGDVALTTAVLIVPGLLLLGIGALWVGVRGSTPWPAWALYGVAFVLVFIGPSLDVPEWSLNLGVFNAVGEVPSEVSGIGVAVEAGLAVIAGAIGTHRLLSRDLG